MSKYVERCKNEIDDLVNYVVNENWSMVEIHADNVKAIYPKAIKQAQLDVLEEVGYRRGAIVKPELVSARLIDKINKLKS